MNKYIFVILIALCSYQAEACKVIPIYSEKNEKDFKFLESFLESSLEIYAGKIINDGQNKFHGLSIQVFITKKIWRLGFRIKNLKVKTWYKNE